MGALPQALARLLLWVKKQIMSEDDFNAIVALEHHYYKRSDRWLEEFENNEDAVLEPTLQTAYQVKQTVNSKLGLGQVQKLLCIVSTILEEQDHPVQAANISSRQLLHNAGAICPPETVTQYGTFLDLVVSTINHCCDPNAHTFFEGRELRCRALKDIPAGTEITLHYYPDPRFDALLRRSVLDKYMYIKCNCESNFALPLISFPSYLKSIQAGDARMRSPRTYLKLPGAKAILAWLRRPRTSLTSSV